MCGFSELIGAVGLRFGFRFLSVFCFQCFPQTVLRATKLVLMHGGLICCKLHERAPFHGCVKLLYKSF